MKEMNYEFLRELARTEDEVHEAGSMSEVLKPCSVCGEDAASINTREGSIDFKPVTIFYGEPKEQE